jgi:hypothetical protein
LDEQSTPARFVLKHASDSWTTWKSSKKVHASVEEKNPTNQNKKKNTVFSVRKKLEVLDVRTDAVEKGKSSMTVAKEFGICRSSVVTIMNKRTLGIGPHRLSWHGGRVPLNE